MSEALGEPKAVRRGRRSPTAVWILRSKVKGGNSYRIRWVDPATGKMLADRGFRAVLVDLRGHGRSSGDWLTYGVQESRDLSQVLDALTEGGLLSGRVGVYGTSYGGATALMLAGRDPRVKAVVTVAAFSTMREVTAHNIRRYLLIGPLLSDGWVNDAIGQAGRLADFNPDDASPLAAVTRTKARLLIIHGTADPTVPFAMGRELFERLAAPKFLLGLEGAGHSESVESQVEPPIPARAAAQRAVIAFLDAEYHGRDRALDTVLAELAADGNVVDAD